jgi:hypothetical protein
MEHLLYATYQVVGVAARRGLFGRRAARGREFVLCGKEQITKKITEYTLSPLSFKALVRTSNAAMQVK